MAQKKDEGLNGNEKIEQAVCQLQQEPTQEQLAHTLTVIRRRMRENGQVVVAVEPNPASEQMQLRALRTADGASWWYAFTSFEEEMKSAEAVQSTFLVEFEKLLDAPSSWTRPCSGSSRDKHERTRLPHFGASRRALFIW